MAATPRELGIRERVLEELSREYDSLRRRVVSYLCRKFRLDLVKAQDQADEAMEQAVAHADQYDEARPLLAWLCGIAHHLHVDHLKSAEYRSATANTDDLEDLLAGPKNREPVETYRLKRLADVFQKAFGQLPTLQSRAMEVRYVFGYERKDAAKTLNVTVRQLDEAVRRAKLSLRKNHELWEEYHGCDHPTGGAETHQEGTRRNERVLRRASSRKCP